MNIESIKLQDCLRGLDFEPEIDWPQALPCYSYNQELLCGFNRPLSSNETVIPLQGKSLPLFIKALYPQLSFMELIRLSSKLLPLNSNDFEELWSLYQYRDIANIRPLISKVLVLPKEVQKWLHQKKVGPQDLAPFKALETINLLQDYWDLFLKSQFSKSDGVKTLELLIELILLGFSTKEIIPEESLNGSTWYQHLYALRFPKSSLQDQKSEELVRQALWPNKTEARWTRRGDRSGVELKLFFTHPDELKKILILLEKTSKDLVDNKQLESIWSKN